MMHTFKQFLDESELSDLARRLFFQREIHLSKEAAIVAAEWFRTAGLLGSIRPTSIPEDGWDRIIDWAEAYQEQTGGTSLYRLQNGAVTLPLLVKGVVSKVMSEKYKITEAEELKELAYVLAIRKELGCTREQAEELVLWMKNEKDWGDLDHDAQGPVIDRWDPDIVKDHKHPGMSYDDYVMDELATAIRHNFKLDAREIL